MEEIVEEIVTLLSNKHILVILNGHNMYDKYTLINLIHTPLNKNVGHDSMNHLFTILFGHKTNLREQLQISASILNPNLIGLRKPL